MKTTAIIVRVLMGLMFFFSSVIVLFKLAPMPELKGNVKLFMDGITVSVYLLPLIKITELICSLAFISGRFVTLATLVIFPIILNIVLYHLFLAPEGLPIAILLLMGNLFLAFFYRKNYQSLFLIK